MYHAFVVQAEARELIAIVRAFRSTALKLARVTSELVREAVQEFLALVSRRIVESVENTGRGWA
jgi:hypothetical protein